MPIQIMPDALANQIAAGEVIERPASVVKELIENAIDAGADKVDVHIEESGMRLIRVTDNGAGIPYEEVPAAFKRHATSKLLSSEDLFRIRTLGFRGEALPSIASVSKVTIETAQAGEKGRHLILEGGKVTEDRSASAREGTMIQVEDIFFNTPARLKHVRTLQTELSHITDSINRFALAHPAISFKLVHEGSTLTRTPGNDNLKQAIAGVYGVSSAKKMRKITGENFDFKMAGYISLPELNRSNRSYITIVVNGRYIKNYAINKAITEGYGSKLMINRYPLAVLHIEMDPLLLDVNVHPTKHEVRISNETDLCDLIKQSVQQVMNEEVRIPSGLENIDQNKQTKKDTPTYNQTQIDFHRDKSHVRSFKSQVNSYSQSDISDEQPFIQEKIDQTTKAQKTQHETAFSSEGALEQSRHVTDSPLEVAEDRLDYMGETSELTTDQDTQLTNRDGFPALDYIGQMHGTYLFAQNERGLYIIDQHAAQERVKYEYYRRVIDQNGTAQQNLLVPIVLEYPTNETIEIRQQIEQLEAAGIFLEAFGKNTFILNSHPSWFISGQEEATVKEMIDFLLDKKELTVKKFREATAIMMSCKRSIKANHHLSDNEARALIEDLSNCENPYNCPHGRPTLVQLTNLEIEKMFKRIQDR